MREPTDLSARPLQTGRHPIDANWVRDGAGDRLRQPLARLLLTDKAHASWLWWRRKRPAAYLFLSNLNPWPYFRTQITRHLQLRALPFPLPQLRVACVYV